MSESESACACLVYRFAIIISLERSINRAIIVVSSRVEEGQTGLLPLFFLAEWIVH